MYSIVKSSKFDKSYKKIDEKYLIFLDKTLARLFFWPPFEREFNVHLLKWKYSRYFSINTTWDFRIIFSIDKNNNTI